MRPRRRSGPAFKDIGGKVLLSISLIVILIFGTFAGVSMFASAQNSTSSEQQSQSSDNSTSSAETGGQDESSESTSQNSTASQAADSAITRSFSYSVLLFEGDVAAEITMTLVWQTDGTVEITDNRGYGFVMRVPQTEGAVTLSEDGSAVIQSVAGDDILYDIRWTPVENEKGFTEAYKFGIVGQTKDDTDQVLLLHVDTGGREKLKMEHRSGHLLVTNNYTSSENREPASSIANSSDLAPAVANATQETTSADSFAAREGIGLNWEDAIGAGYAMDFDELSSSIEVPVKGAFAIDPVTVATTSVAVSPPLTDYYEGERRVVRIGSVFFAFYYDGLNIVYKYSTDNGATWSTANSTSSGVLASDNYRWTITSTSFGGSERIVLVYYSASGSTTSFYAKRGTVLGTNITWENAIPSPLFSKSSFSSCIPGNCAAVVASNDTNGNVFAAFRWLEAGASSYTYSIWRSNDGGLNWGVSLSPAPASSGFRISMALTELSGGKMLFAYATLGNTEFTYRVFSGSIWSNEMPTSGASMTGLKRISSDSNSTHTAMIAYKDNLNFIRVAKWDSSTGNFLGTEIADQSLAHDLPSISIPPDDRIHIYSLSGGKVYETTKIGSTWCGPSKSFGDAFVTPDQLTAAISYRQALWTEQSSPFNVRFGGTPNAPADADAGPDQTVGKQVPVTLDGSRSCDLEGDPFTYFWTQTAGPPVTLFGSATANPTFTSPFVLDDTVLTFQLTVTGGGTSFDTVNVTVVGKVASSSDTRLESSGEQRVSYFDGTRHWVFYYSGTNIRYKYSADGGLTWSGEAVSPVSNLAANSYFGVYGEGNTVIITASNTTMAYTRKGTISSETINWNSSKLVFGVSGTNSPGQNYYPSFEKIGTKLFLAFNIIDKGKNVGRVFQSNDLAETWPSNLSINLHTNQNAVQPAIVGIAKYASTSAIAVYAQFGDAEFKYKTYSGSTWTNQPSTTQGAGLAAGANKTRAFSIAGDGTCAWAGYVPSNSGGQLRAAQFCEVGFPGSLQIVFKDLTSGTNLYPTIGSENGNVQLLYTQGGIIRAIANLNNGGNTAWQSEIKPFGSSFLNPQYIHAAKNTPSFSGLTLIPVVWREQSASPLVKFGTTNPLNWLTKVKVLADGFFETRQTEPHVASSRLSSTPDTLVTGSIYDGRCRVSRSTDSGQSWQLSSYEGKPGANALGGDPSVVSQLDGTFILGCLGITFGTEPFTGYKIIASSALGFVKSTDGGLTWTSAAPEIIAPPEGPQIDKPWIATDWGAYTNHNNKLYACWTEFDYSNDQTRIHFAEITQSGPVNDKILDSATWNDTADRDKGPYVQGCQIVTGPGKAGIGNEIFAVYERIESYTSGKILFNRNYNGGDPSSWLPASMQVGTIQRFTDTTSCVGLTENTINDGCLEGVNDVWFRSQHLPNISVDKYGDPHIVWTTYANNNADIAYTASYDCAVDERQCTFAPQVILDANTNDQFNPSVIISGSAVNPRGIIFVTLNDKREDNVSTTNETWKPWEFSCVPIATSGTSSCLNASEWTNKKIADDESIVDNPNLHPGEYNGVASTRTNQAFAVHYYRQCDPSFGCSFSSEDVFGYGGK